MNMTAHEMHQQELKFHPHPPNKVETIKAELKGLPRSSAEKFMRQKLGEIEGVFIVDFKDYTYTCRITTNTEIYRVKTRMRPENLTNDLKLYDPWSTRWMVHVPYMCDIETVKATVDPGDLLHAHMLIQFRKMAIMEKPEDYKKSESDLYSYEDIAGGDSMMEEEEGATQLYDCNGFTTKWS